MPTLTDAITKEPVRALAYGTTGSGKTTLWGRMAEYEAFRPIYCLDFDLRIASLRARLSADAFKFIYYDEFRDGRVQGEAFIAAQSISNNPASLKGKYGVDFKTIVCDSGTFMGKMIMNRVLMLDGGKAPTTTPQLQNYMQAMSLTEEFVSKMCASGLNFIFTCHEDTTKDEISGRLFKAVDLTGKMANRIPGYFNELWHCEISQKPGAEPNYVVRTRSDVSYSARTSFGHLSAVEPQETIWKKILEHK